MSDQKLLTVELTRWQIDLLATICYESERAMLGEVSARRAALNTDCCVEGKQRRIEQGRHLSRAVDRLDIIRECRDALDKAMK